MNKLHFIILLAIVAGCIGCSSLPSEQDGRAALQSHISKESDGHIRLVDFKKEWSREQFLRQTLIHDGVHGDDRVYPRYVEKGESINGDFHSFDGCRDNAPGGWETYSTVHKHFTKGKRINLTGGKMGFTYTDNGWMPTR